METETIIKFIKKCIDDTKSNNLCWEVLPSNSHIQNEKSLNANQKNITVDMLLSPNDFTNCYYTKYKEGFFFLKQASTPVSIYPLHDGCIFLYVQKNSSAYSELIAVSSNKNSEINILLKRLFIIVETQNVSADTLVNDFLNS